MIYSIIERGHGSELASFDLEAEALDFVRDEMAPSDQWALFEFGSDPSHTVLVAAGDDLLQRSLAATPAQPTWIPIATGGQALSMAIVPNARSTGGVGVRGETRQLFGPRYDVSGTAANTLQVT